MHVQMEEFEIAEWLCGPDPRGLLTRGEQRRVAELLDHLARTGMDRENDGKFDRNLTQSLKDPEQHVRVIDVRRPVQCQCGEAVLLQTKAPHQIEFLSRCAVSHERVDHYVT